MGVLLFFMLVTGVALATAEKDLLKVRPGNSYQLAIVLAAFGRVYFGAGLAGLLVLGAMQLYAIITML